MEPAAFGEPPIGEFTANNEERLQIIPNLRALFLKNSLKF